MLQTQTSRLNVPIQLPIPPDRFRPAENVRSVVMAKHAPSFARKGSRKGAKGAGVRYEERVQQVLLTDYYSSYLPSPWLRFVDDHGVRWCQPDGLIIDVSGGRITIVEMKTSHTGEAWWQLHKLYLPVVRELFGADFEYRCLEVVRYYDPTTLFPLVRLAPSPDAAPALPFTGVHICTPPARRGER